MKISVILTLYNSEKSVERTIKSILGQEGIMESFELELIVIDDCSTDRTRELLRQLQVPYYSTKSNSGGPNKGRNIGLGLASGDYYCIVDHDDEWKPNRILTALSYIDKSDIISSGHTTYYTAKNKSIENVSRSISGYIFHPENETFLARMMKSNDGQKTYLGSLLLHNKYKSILFEEHFGVDDYDWILRIFHHQTALEVCESLYIRHLDEKNLSRSSTYRKKDFYYSLYALEDYQNEYPREYKIAYKRIHGSRARYYYTINNMKKARFYFIQAERSWKNIAYLFTSFLGYKWVLNRFRVFE